MRGGGWGGGGGGEEIVGRGAGMREFFRDERESDGVGVDRAGVDGAKVEAT